MIPSRLADAFCRSPRIALVCVGCALAAGAGSLASGHTPRPKFAGVAWNSANGNLTAITEDGDIYFSEVYLYGDGRPPARIWQRGVNVTDETQAWDEIRERDQQAK